MALKLITFEIELTQKLFRKKVIFIPKPIAPWRGIRLGLLLLIKNSKSRVEKKIRPRKKKFLYNILDEFWDIIHGKGITCKNVIEFTLNVLLHAENYRSTKLFTVKPIRRIGKTLSKSFLQKYAQIRTRKVKKNRKVKKFLKEKNFLTLKSNKKVKSKKTIKQKKYKKALSLRFMRLLSGKKVQKRLHRPPKILNKIISKIKKASKKRKFLGEREISEIFRDLNRYIFVKKKFIRHKKLMKKEKSIKKAPLLRFRFSRRNQDLYKTQRSVCNLHLVIESLEKLSREKRKQEKELRQRRKGTIIKKKKKVVKKITKKEYLLKLYKILKAEKKLTKKGQKKNRAEIQFLLRNLLLLKKFNQRQRHLNFFDPAYTLSSFNLFYNNLYDYLKKKKKKLKSYLCLLTTSKVQNTKINIEKSKFLLEKNLDKLKTRLAKLKTFLVEKPGVDYYNLLVEKLNKRNQSHRLFPLCLIHRQQRFELFKINYLIKLNSLLLKKKIKNSITLKDIRRRFIILNPLKHTRQKNLFKNFLKKHRNNKKILAKVCSKRYFNSLLVKSTKKIPFKEKKKKKAFGFFLSFFALKEKKKLKRQKKFFKRLKQNRIFKKKMFIKRYYKKITKKKTFKIFYKKLYRLYFFVKNIRKGVLYN